MLCCHLSNFLSTHLRNTSGTHLRTTFACYTTCVAENYHTNSSRSNNIVETREKNRSSILYCHDVVEDVVIDSRFDLTVILESPNRTLHVVRRSVLQKANPVWNTMLRPRAHPHAFVESAATTVTFHDDDAWALRVLFSLLHDRVRDLPGNVKHRGLSGTSRTLRQVRCYKQCDKHYEPLAEGANAKN